MPNPGLSVILRGMDAQHTVYAHTLVGQGMDAWEPLYGQEGHAEKVAQVMDSFGNPFPQVEEGTVREWLHLMAHWHDMGKAAPDFQRYLQLSHEGKCCASADHKHAAARWACDHLPGAMGILLAYAFAGHHSGLPEGGRLFREILPSFSLEKQVQESLPEEYRTEQPAGVVKVGAGARSSEDLAFAWCMAVRMLHSCLVDADWLATEAFADAERSAERRAVAYDSLPLLRDRLEAHLAERERDASSLIQCLRREIHLACRDAAKRAGGVYRLNVPTGGGKTLSSLSFALRHAVLHGKRRVIYVIPFTSIIDQTAQEFRRILGENNVLEHQSNLRPETDTRLNRYAAENWDAPLIVTTSVQFFESLFASRNSRCRKLHNIVESVIIFDEAQSLPARLLAPCLTAMKTLQRDYACTLLLCTATQPTLTNEGRFTIGWEKEEVSSLLGEDMEERLARSMKRVELSHLGTLTQEKLLEHFLRQGVPSALFIVNLTRQAQELYRLLKSAGCEAVYHLSARMCPAHRLRVLEEVNQRLAEGRAVILVATRVVEAGVDLSFPVVYRDRCGLDSLAQAAGRCNRHGEAERGLVFSFDAEEFKIPSGMSDLRDGCYAIGDVRELLPEGELFSSEAVEMFFRKWYRKRGESHPGWDERKLLAECVGKGTSLMKSWDFPEMAARFQMIPDGQRSLLVPYGEEFVRLRQCLCALDQERKMPGRDLFRQIQRRSVSVYTQDWHELPLTCVHREAGLFALADPALYDEAVGLLRAGEQEESYVV